MHSSPSRPAIDSKTYDTSGAHLAHLVQTAALSEDARRAIATQAASLVRDIRSAASPGLMEVFLAEYGLSTDEGIALMCLAEALLRVPDSPTIDALIEDKIAPSDWAGHLGRSTSPLVNASTWALMLTGRVLNPASGGPVAHLRGAVRRLGEPVIRAAVGRAMREMGRQFVLGEDISAALRRAAVQEEKGYHYSYDMLGEAARTQHDADGYFDAYLTAINSISSACSGHDPRRNPGISIKLSALHPRYEEAQQPDVLAALTPRVVTLCVAAKQAGMGLNIDAEEAARLALSLDVIDAALADPALADWDGFGVVVQAYAPRAGAVIDWLTAQAKARKRRLMVRLVKGAYWDSEIKKAQVKGLRGFPVWTRKPETDVSYIACARKLLEARAHLYPQFATHNAHSAAAILHLARALGAQNDQFEFQRLHGMGAALHELLRQQNGTNCRIYAPVGAHRDLLAYLVRRLLENGANSSFVNQIVDENVPPETVASDPFAELETAGAFPANALLRGTDLFAPERANARGWDLDDRQALAAIDAARAPFADSLWQARPRLANTQSDTRDSVTTCNPSNGAPVGQVITATPADVERAFAAAVPWDAPLAARRAAISRAADLFEENHGEIFALLAREAGKTLPDGVAELREAVDFLRYYAANAYEATGRARVFACISPWNFPLAIFTGQIAAALAMGQAVIAKPAGQTPLIADLAVRLMHDAGVPQTALQLLSGGPDVGAAITASARLGGVAFTGSTATALKIRASMAENGPTGAPLIAETGGLNAMLVDSTALPEQAVQAVIESAFQSAGQRCSALRCLYVQEEIADEFTKMLIGAMDLLRSGDPWQISTDSGPVIDDDAARNIRDYIDAARSKGRVIHESTLPAALDDPAVHRFIAPTLISVSSIRDLEREVFGPVLHIARFKSRDLTRVIADVNATGYGLTFGLHSRIDDRVETIASQIHAGNTYINRNQIGAIVGSQPFGGEGLSGTGPKAGGPHYLPRFAPAPRPEACAAPWERSMPRRDVEAALHAAEKTPAATPPAQVLRGPTGELNRLSFTERLPTLCLGPGPAAAEAQAQMITALGGRAALMQGRVDPACLGDLQGFGGALYWEDGPDARAYAQTLAARSGPILPLITGSPDAAHALLERHLCVDTTAAGGNAALLSAMS